MLAAESGSRDPQAAATANFRRRHVNFQSLEIDVFLSCLLFLKRLATEARLKAIEDRCSVIKSAHIRAVAKVVLKKSRG
ncbi:unnamed protein product [Ranitomeya imitator]|uniref:Centromere protein W n=1 Tax=Ranitomeya imitator TaxID=111125 RepID=A0ABN9M4A0_9NEOB|nr:unnamed protein product [Ranitomeya imitator]